MSVAAITAAVVKEILWSSHFRLLWNLGVLSDEQNFTQTEMKAKSLSFYLQSLRCSILQFLILFFLVRGQFRRLREYWPSMRIVGFFPSSTSKSILRNLVGCSITDWVDLWVIYHGFRKMIYSSWGHLYVSLLIRNGFMQTEGKFVETFFFPFWHSKGSWA